MERLDSSVRQALGGAGVPDAAALTAVAAAWPAAVGPAIARSAWPLRLGRQGTLHVACVSSTWAFELGRMAPELLEALRGALGEATPAELRFAPGPVPAPGPAPGPEPGTAAPAEVTPSPGDRELAARLAAPVADEELREMVARAAAASLARARHNRRF